MKRILIMVSLLFIVGCFRSPREYIIYNLDPAKCFKLCKGTLIDFRHIPDDELTTDLKRHQELILLANPDANEMQLKTRKLEYAGAYIDNEIMEKVYKLKAEEDLRMTWTDRLWKGLGL